MIRTLVMRALQPRAVALLTVWGLALACSGGGVEALLAESRAFQDAGQFAESIGLLREILEISPDLPEANYLLGVALVQTRQPSLAVWSLEKAARSSEYALKGGSDLAETFLKIEAFEDAERAANRVLELDPEHIRALQMRTHAKLGAGRQEEALEDANRLLEATPDDDRSILLRAAILGDLKRYDEAEEGYKRLKQMALAGDDPNQAASGWLALAKFYQDRGRDPQRAEAEYAGCVEAFPTHALVLRLATRFFDETKRPERGTELWRRAVREAPESLAFRVSLANRLRSQGAAGEAETVLIEATETFGTAIAWNALSEFRRRVGDSEGALRAIEKAIEITDGGSDPLRSAQADLLVNLGQLDRAEEVSRELDKPIYRNLIQGKILLARGDAEAALSAFEKGLSGWPNNAGARYLAGLAASQLGDFDRAISELREAVRVDPGATDAALVLARLHLARHDYADARGFAQKYLQSQTGYEVEALVILARAARGLDKVDLAREILAKLRDQYRRPLEAAVQLAALEREQSGPAAGLKVIREAGIDLAARVSEPALRSMTLDLVSLGRADAALAQLDATLAENPKRASLYAMRGTVLASVNRNPDATAAFRRALELDENYAAALIGLATLSENRGDRAAAIELFDRAARAKPGNRTAAYKAAQLVLADGDAAEAERRLRDLVRRHPGSAGARNDLAWLLAERGEELDLALRLAREALRIDSSADVIDTLAWVQLKQGDLDAAVESFELALEQESASAAIRYHLGLALSDRGDTQQALAAFRQALDAGPFPEAEAARREIARLEQGD